MKNNHVGFGILTNDDLLQKKVDTRDFLLDNNFGSNHVKKKNPSSNASIQRISIYTAARKRRSLSHLESRPPLFLSTMEKTIQPKLPREKLCRFSRVPQQKGKAGIFSRGGGERAKKR